MYLYTCTFRSYNGTFRCCETYKETYRVHVQYLDKVTKYGITYICEHTFHSNNNVVQQIVMKTYY